MRSRRINPSSLKKSSSKSHLRMKTREGYGLSRATSVSSLHSRHSEINMRKIFEKLMRIIMVGTHEKWSNMPRIWRVAFPTKGRTITVRSIAVADRSLPSLGMTALRNTSRCSPWRQGSCSILPSLRGISRKRPWTTSRFTQIKTPTEVTATK